MRYVILHNIRSAHNVGAVFRTADGAGVCKIFLTGYTPAPIDRFGRMVEEIAKTSLGAVDTVLWEQRERTMDVVLELQKSEVQIVAVEQHPRAIEYRMFSPAGDVAYVFGNEIDGVPDDICEAADAVIHIPMRGQKESLNVSVAAGIILFNT